MQKRRKRGGISADQVRRRNSLREPRWSTWHGSHSGLEDGVQNSNSSGSIEFESSTKLVNSPDDIIATTNFIPATFGGTSAGTGIAFDVSNRFHYGRLRFGNAAGSELVTLPMRLRTQRFEGQIFVDDGDDSCSGLVLSALDLTPSPVGPRVDPDTREYSASGGRQWTDSERTQ